MIEGRFRITIDVNVEHLGLAATDRVPEGAAAVTSQPLAAPRVPEPASDTLRQAMRLRALKGVRPGPPGTDCTFHINVGGQLRLAGLQVPVAVLLYEQHHGVCLPPDQFVWHTCPTPGCVTVAHLMAGTRHDLARWQKARWSRL